MNILIIEDQKDIVDFLQKGLVSEHHNVEVAYDGETGLEMTTEEDYDLIILDIMLPKIDGLKICRKLRSWGQNTPIIMLTAKDTVEDKINGLDAGADDYLIKPFSFSELLARIRALSRRNKQYTTKKLGVADLELNPESYEVTRGKKNIALSATEFKLLKYLLENKNRVLSKIKILENVWGYHFDPGSNVVDVYIKFLRNKVDSDFKLKLIKTVRGVGYKICV